jgi:small subunit ribosomal protein S3
MVYSGVSNVDIERSAGKIRIKIYTARPGIVIGRRGSEIDRLRSAIQDLTDSEVFIDIKEIKIPQIEAQLVAETVGQQLEKRVSFRRAMKKTVTATMSKGAEGIKIKCKGRLGGAEIARTEGYKEGKIPLGTFRADVDYGCAEANTTHGKIGIKVWIYKGDALLRQESAESDEKEPSRKAQTKKGAVTDHAVNAKKS